MGEGPGAAILAGRGGAAILAGGGGKTALFAIEIHFLEIMPAYP